MNRSKSFVLFIFFLACFYVGLTLKFQYITLHGDESSDAFLVIAGAAILSGLFLGLSLQALNTSKKVLRALLEGVAFAAILFVGVSLAETELSENELQLHSVPEAFSQISGHCGISVGRTILRALHDEEPYPQGKISEFKLDQSCRLHHLEKVMQSKSTSCEASEDKIDCLIRWMGAVAEQGYWSRNTRKFFFDQVMKAWPESKKYEALVAYALKDLDLESGRPSILRQVGMSEDLSEHYLFMQEKDELDHLLLTKEVFETISPLLKDVQTTPPPPYLFKFKDTKEELQEKLAKIPELQKEVEQLGSHPKAQ